MVVADPEMISQADVDEEQSSNHGGGGSEPYNNGGNITFPNLGTQSSIYSLTLDEFQHTLCENNGKNFGSMNMDEFLNSIWTAEENHHHHHSHHLHHHNSGSAQVNNSGSNLIARQASLPRQGSLSLPAPLCRKTVEEVWSEIQEQQEQSTRPQRQEEVGNSDSAQRQATFGEMTLEDFLVKAGVVREQCGNLPAQLHPQYGGFVARPVMGGPFQGNNNNGYTTPAASSYGARVSNINVGGPVSPVSPEGICGPGQVDNAGVGGQYGMDMAALRAGGRKRVIDGPVEMVVERRQRRMIKNRESAARSRARKQAYTVELEAELNQLKEENTQLKQALAELERQRKQQYLEEEQVVAITRAQRAQEKLKTMRRSTSCNLY